LPFQHCSSYSRIGSLWMGYNKIVSESHHWRHANATAARNLPPLSSTPRVARLVSAANGSGGNVNALVSPYATPASLHRCFGLDRASPGHRVAGHMFVELPGTPGASGARVLNGARRQRMESCARVARGLRRLWRHRHIFTSLRSWAPYYVGERVPYGQVCATFRASRCFNHGVTARGCQTCARRH
jgi:hypothetical protein